MGKKVFVTGGTGFVGMAVVEELVQRGFEVYCLVRNPGKLSLFTGLPVQPVPGDLHSDFTIPDDTEYIIHLAGVTKAVSYYDYYRGNVESTRNLIRRIKAMQTAPARIVGISSQAAAGPSPDGTPVTEDMDPKPITWYGKTKLLAEQELRMLSPEYPVTIIRPPAVYGPRDRDILNIFRFLNYGLNVKIGKEEQRVSVIFVRNLAAGIIDAMIHQNAVNETFFLTDGTDYSWSELIRMIAEIMNKSFITLPLPFPVASATAGVIEFFSRLSGTPTILNRQKMLEVKEKYWLCSPQKAIRRWGYQPRYPTAEALKITYDWYKAHGWI